MLMRTALWRRAHPVHVLAAAILTLAVLAAASAEVQPAGPAGAPTLALAEGLPGEGLPPSPGPTDPNAP